MRAKFGVGEALVIIGAVAMIVSVFLCYMDGVHLMSVHGSGFGLPLFLVAALCFGAFAARARGILPGLAFIGLGLAGLALVGNYAYYHFTFWNYGLGELREGFYLAGVGSLVVIVGGILKIR